ncbi:MAG: phosphate transport system protein [Bryobacterales bacterium]|nr:phosphate transport system protein [Bryobacterales bacterium]
MRRFDEELNTLSEALQEMGSLVAQSIHRSVLSLVEKNEDYAHQVVRDEARINQLEIQIDDLATTLIARESPVAGDMRFVVVAIKINTDLERMGDMAVGIVERSLAALRQPELPMNVSFTEMANLVESMVLTSLDAFVKRDPQLARTVLTSDDAVDKLRNLITRQMIELMKRDPSTVERAVDYILIARRLERIADHATNVAEDVIFMVKGVDVRHRTQVDIG